MRYHAALRAAGGVKHCSGAWVFAEPEELVGAMCLLARRSPALVSSDVCATEAQEPSVLRAVRSLPRKHHVGPEPQWRRVIV